MDLDFRDDSDDVLSDNGDGDDVESDNDDGDGLVAMMVMIRVAQTVAALQPGCKEMERE